jgi:hypothetical protein
LTNHCHEFNLNDKVTSAVAGFADTWPMFTSLYKEEGWENFKQSTIVQNILQQPYAAQNALEDARMLQEVVQKSCADNKDILTHSFLLAAVVQEIDRDKHKGINSILCKIWYPKKSVALLWQTRLLQVVLTLPI